VDRHSSGQGTRTIAPKRSISARLSLASRLLPGAIEELVVGWEPPVEGDERGSNRSALAAHLDAQLEGDERFGEISVETPPDDTTPDIAVGGRVGLLVLDTVPTDRDVGRELAEFAGRYEYLLVVAIDVRDEAAWERIQSVPTGSGGGRTEYAFCEAGAMVSTEAWGSQRATILGGAVFVLSVLAGIGTAGLVLYTWSAPTVSPIPVEQAGAYVALAFTPALVMIYYAGLYY
jgi:hypothetical protein